MKKIFLLVLLLIGISNVFSQNLNPYEQFGYQTKYEYVRTKKDDGLYIKNSIASTKVKALLISLKTKQIFVLDEKDSITQISNIPENVLTRFLSTDPLTKKYPELTPYQFASNTPIQGIDLDGLEIYLTTSGELLGSFGKSTALRIVTDATVQTQVRADATAGLTQNNKNYNSYHTSVTTLNTTINMLSKAETTTKAEGFSAGVTHKDEIINGSTGLARLSREAAGNFMITPEGTPSITAPADAANNANTTIIHSHPINSFAYSNTTNTFTILPYATDIRNSLLFGSTPEEGTAFNANETVSPSPADKINTENSKGYNWILIGNIRPITYNSATGALSPGTSGAVFYKGNINTESFRINKSDLNNLSEQATLQTAVKILSNYINRPQ